MFSHKSQPTSWHAARVMFAALLLLMSAPATKGLARCPFCSLGAGTSSLADGIKEANFVLVGKLSNAKANPNPGPGEPDGTTDLTVEVVVKDHELTKGKTKITLPRFIYTPDGDQSSYVVFGEVVMGKLDPYRTIPVASKDFPGYLQEVVKTANASSAERLGFFFKYLDHEDSEIAADAYKEFAIAPYKEVAAAARFYDPDKLLDWIRDKKTQSYRIGLYGCLLGVCGRKSDAPLLRQIIDDPMTRPDVGVDGLMGGYCVLEPAAGVDYVLSALTTKNNSFNFRYAALRTVRFILSDLPQVDRNVVLERMTQALDASDIADLIIDEFRHNQYWKPCDKIIGLYDKPGYDLQMIKRSIIRFVLKCPEKSAGDFLAKVRKADPEFVANVEEILRFEESQAVGAKPGK